jgi:hypothetical protein
VDGVVDACELARCLPHVIRGPTGRGGGASKQCDSEQPLWRQEAVIYNEPGRRAGTRGDGGDPSPGVLRSGCRRWGGFVYNGTCLWRGQSKAKPQARNAVSTVSFCRSFTPSTQTKRNKISRLGFSVLPLRRSGEMTRAFSVRLDGRALRVCRGQSANFQHAAQRRVRVVAGGVKVCSLTLGVWGAGSRCPVSPVWKIP